MAAFVRHIPSRFVICFAFVMIKNVLSLRRQTKDMCYFWMYVCIAITDLLHVLKQSRAIIMSPSGPLSGTLLYDFLYVVEVYVHNKSVRRSVLYNMT